MRRVTRAALKLCIILIAAFTSAQSARVAPADEAAIRDFMSRWNHAYTHLDAKGMAALETSDFQLIDRFGEWIQSKGQHFNEQLWDMTFKEIYKGKPGPARSVEAIRFLTPEVAIVQAHTNWGVVTLDDGTKIPPHGEIDTFVLVRNGSEWKVNTLNIHNQMPPELAKPGEKAPVPVSPTGSSHR